VNVELQRHATLSNALRAAVDAPLTTRAVVRSATLLASVALAALVVGCGTTSQTTTSVPASVSSGSASSSLPAPTGSVAPSPAGSPSLPTYDASIGGIYQLASWDIAATDTVRLVIVAPQPSKKPRLDFVRKPGRLDIMLRDIRPVEAGSSVAGSSGIIARARLVFPPDDALAILRLTLKDTAPVTGTVVGVRRLSPAAWMFTVTVRQKATP
jgi:hypothetical protein